MQRTNQRYNPSQHNRTATVATPEDIPAWESRLQRKNLSISFNYYYPARIHTVNIASMFYRYCVLSKCGGEER